MQRQHAMTTGLLFLMMSHGSCISLMAQGSRAVAPRQTDSAVADRVAGCYELDSGWQSDTAMAKFEPVPRGPVRFELTKKRARGWDELSASERVVFFDVRSDSIDARYGRWLFTTWNRLSDTEPKIHVSSPMPMAGFDLVLRPHNTDLVGTIGTFTDAIPPDPAHRPGRYGASAAAHAVMARRISCPT